MGLAGPVAASQTIVRRCAIMNKPPSCRMRTPPNNAFRAASRLCEKGGSSLGLSFCSRSNSVRVIRISRRNSGARKNVDEPYRKGTLAAVAPMRLQAVAISMRNFGPTRLTAGRISKQRLQPSLQPTANQTPHQLSDLAFLGPSTGSAARRDASQPCSGLLCSKIGLHMLEWRTEGHIGGTTSQAARVENRKTTAADHPVVLVSVPSGRRSIA